VEERYHDQALTETWQVLLDLRAEVARAIEMARRQKIIGHSLDTAVAITAPERIHSLLRGREEDLRALFIVSQIRLEEGGADYPITLISDTIPGVKIRVRKAPGTKCPRCWTYSEHVGEDPQKPDSVSAAHPESKDDETPSGSVIPFHRYRGSKSRPANEALDP